MKKFKLKLNTKGFSLDTMIGFLIDFLVFLLIIVVLGYRAGL